MIEEPVIVLFHLNGGYTKVFLERTKGSGLANGGVSWDISTDEIPTHLRKIGSRFVIKQTEPAGKIEIHEIET